MSLPHRSAVFLQEMGIGPQWLLRDRVHAEPEAVDEEAAPAALDEVPTPVPAPVAAPAPAAAPAASDDDMAWFDNAPAPPPKPPTLKQAAPARPKAPEPQPSDEDTSWFDAVPAAPAARPSRRTAATDEDIGAMDWHALQAAVRRCTRCDLCESRRVAVPGLGDVKARWLVLGMAPNAQDEDAGEPLSGEPGQLLANMLRAVDLSTQGGAYVTTLVKCRPEGDRPPNPDELAACRPYLERELALTEAGLALTLGGVTAKGFVGVAARGKVLRHGELPVVATYHPADLLKQPQDKPKAWADLCLARAAHAGKR